MLDYKYPGTLFLALPARRKVLRLDFLSEFHMSKMIQIFLIFFSLRNKILGAHFLLKIFFGNFNFKTTSYGKIMPDSWPSCKGRQSIHGHLWSRITANFVRPFEKLGCRRCRFRGYWLYSLVSHSIFEKMSWSDQRIFRGFYQISQGNLIGPIRCPWINSHATFWC